MKNIVNKKPKAIIFDWDNTIIDTWPFIHNAIDETMVAMGHEPWGLEKVKNTVFKSMRESFPAIFGKDWKKAGEIYKANYLKQDSNQLKILDGALDLINEAYDSNITLFIVSNKMGPTLRQEVQNLNITNKFFSIIGAHDASLDKPSNKPVKLALENSDINPENDLIWFIGDSHVDVECAINSNCQPIFFGKENDLPAEILQKSENNKDKPLMHFRKHQEITDHLKELY